MHILQNFNKVHIGKPSPSFLLDFLLPSFISFVYFHYSSNCANPFPSFFCRLFVAIERTINVARGYLSKDRLQYVNSCSEMSPSDGVVNRLNSILLSMSQHQAPLKKRRSALNTMLPPVSGLPPINTTLNDLFDGEKLHSNNLLWTFQVNSVLAHCAHRTFYDHLTLFLENIIHSWSSFTYTTQIFIEYEAEDITMITDDDGGIPSKTTGEQKTSTEGGKARTPRQQLTRMLSGISSQASTPKSRIGNDAETQDAVGSGNPYVCSIDGFIKLTLLFPDKVEAVDANAAPASPSKAQGNAAKAQKIHPIELVMPLLSLINSSLNRVNTASAATMLSVKQVDEDRDDIDQIEEHNDMIDGVGKDKHGKRAKSKNNKKAAKKKDKKLTPSDGEAVNKEKEQAYHIRVPCLLFLTQSQYQAYFYPTNASIVLSANNPTANPARNPLTKNKQGTKGGVKDDSENLQVAAMSSSMFCSPLCNVLFSNPSSNSDGNLQANMGKKQVSVHRMKKGAIGNKASPANKAGKSKYKKKMGYNATPRTGGSNSGNPLPQEVSQHISLHHGADGDSMRSNAPNTSSSAALFA